jgi:hypothetical protein
MDVAPAAQERRHGGRSGRDVDRKLRARSPGDGGYDQVRSEGLDAAHGDTLVLPLRYAPPGVIVLCAAWPAAHATYRPWMFIGETIAGYKYYDMVS